MKAIDNISYAFKTAVDINTYMNENRLVGI